MKLLILVFLLFGLLEAMDKTYIFNNPCEQKEIDEKSFCEFDTDRSVSPYYNYTFEITVPTTADKPRIKFASYAGSDFKCDETHFVVYHNEEFVYKYPECSDEAKKGAVANLCEINQNVVFVSDNDKIFVQICYAPTNKNNRRLPKFYVTPTADESYIPDFKPVWDGSCGRSYYPNHNLRNGEIIDRSLEKQKRIVDGEDAVPHSYPFMTNVGGGGGALLENNFMLTCRHCVYGLNYNTNIIVGRHRHQIKETVNGVTKTYQYVWDPYVYCKIKEIYAPEQHWYDIVIVSLDCGKSFHYTKEIQPICLPEPHETWMSKRNGTDVIIAGNGGLGNGLGGALSVQDAVSQVQPYRTPGHAEGEKKPDFSTVWVHNARGHNECVYYGDSGTSVIGMNNGKYTSYGVLAASAGSINDCYAVYESTQAHLCWIKDVLAGKFKPDDKALHGWKV